MRQSASALLGLGWILACANPFGSEPVEIANALTPEEVVVAEQLAQRQSEGVFPEVIASDCAKNARYFPHLAANSADPLVIAAALRAGGGCGDEGSVDPSISSDLARAAAARLSHPDSQVTLAAFFAADALIAPLPADHPLVTSLIAASSHEKPEMRYEALLVLDRRAWAQEEQVMAAFLKALSDSDHPFIVTEVLRRLRYRASGLVGPDGSPSPPLRSAVLVLTHDLDPGIRGRAALVLARLAPSDEAVIDTLMRMLDDPHGYVRSSAAEALAEIGHAEAIGAIIARIDDYSRNTWDMLPFTRLDGSGEIPHHVGSLFERVDDAYLRALVALSAPMGERAFLYREVSVRHRNLDIIAATRDAKRWYAKEFPAK